MVENPAGGALSGLGDMVNGLVPSEASLPELPNLGELLPITTSTNTSLNDTVNATNTTSGGGAGAPAPQGTPSLSEMVGGLVPDHVQLPELPSLSELIPGFGDAATIHVDPELVEIGLEVVQGGL